MATRNVSRWPFVLPICLIVLAAAAFMFTSGGPGMAKPSGLTVTFIDHAGFLYQAGNKKILVDALTEPSKEWPYKAPSPQMLQDMELGKPPFDNISLLLIGHNHTDHYSAAATVRFLKNNPKAVVVTTMEVCDVLKGAGPDFDTVKSRVVVPELKWKQSEIRQINGIRLETARLKHGDDKEWASTVYAFVFELGGKKVLYAAGTDGHFPEEYTELGYAKRGIDLAFLSYYMMINPGRDGAPASLNKGQIAEVRDLIAPKTTVLMHIQPWAAATVDAMLPELQKELPGAIVFRRELESRTF